MNWRASVWLLCTLVVFTAAGIVYIYHGNSTNVAFCAKRGLQSSYYVESVGHVGFIHPYCYGKNGAVYLMNK